MRHTTAYLWVQEIPPNWWFSILNPESKLRRSTSPATLMTYSLTRKTNESTCRPVKATSTFLLRQIRTTISGSQKQALPQVLGHPCLYRNFINYSLRFLTAVHRNRLYAFMS